MRGQGRGGQAVAIIVYSRVGCVPCLATVRALEARGLAFQIESADHPRAQELAAAHGYRSAPIVEADGRSWSGFRPDEIAKIAPEDGGVNI